MPVKLLRRGSSERLVEVLPLSRSVDDCALCFIVARARATGSYIIKGCGFRPKFSKRKRSAPPSSKSCLRHCLSPLQCEIHTRSRESVRSHVNACVSRRMRET